MKLRASAALGTVLAACACSPDAAGPATLPDAAVDGPVTSPTATDARAGRGPSEASPGMDGRAVSMHPDAPGPASDPVSMRPDARGPASSSDAHGPDPTSHHDSAGGVGHPTREAGMDSATGMDASRPIVDGAVDEPPVCVGGACPSLACHGTVGLPALPFAPAGAYPGDVLAADLDHDGVVDLATANSDGSVGVLRGRGDGTFTVKTNYVVGASAARPGSDLAPRKTTWFA